MTKKQIHRRSFLQGIMGTAALSGSVSTQADGTENKETYNPFNVPGGDLYVIVVIPRVNGKAVCGSSHFTCCSSSIYDVAEYSWVCVAIALQTWPPDIRSVLCRISRENNNRELVSCFEYTLLIESDEVYREILDAADD